MITRAYAVFVKTAGIFVTPFFAETDEVAMRSFRFSLKKFNSVFVKDLELCFIGYFDNVLGILSDCDNHVVDTGLNFLSECVL